MAPHCTPQPSICKPCWHPQLQAKGAMWVEMATSRAGVTAEEGASDANSTSLTAGAETLGTASLGSWWGSLEMVAVGAWQWFLGGGGMEDIGEWDMAPLKSPYRLSTSDPATADLIFCSPSTSNCCTSSLYKLAHFNKSRPWKREKWGLSQRSNLGTGPWRNN